MIRKLLFIVGIMMVCSSCQTVTIRPDGGLKDDVSKPKFERTENFFFWGLMGERHIDAKRVCKDAEITQMQTRQSFLNGFLNAITLGIYSPRSARIWCKSNTKT